MAGCMYNIDPSSEITMMSWGEGPTPQCLVVQLPVTRCVGEDEFLLEIADKRRVYRGFKDTLGRHYIRRKYEVDGFTREAIAQLNQAKLAAEITDDFYGVDAIDMTEWATMPMKGERWQALISYIQASPETDFVFLMRTAVDERAQSLANTMTGTGLLIAEHVKLYPPTAAMLAEYMANVAQIDCKPAVDEACAGFKNMLFSGIKGNYTLARDIAARVIASQKRGLTQQEAVSAAFCSRGYSSLMCR